MQIIRRDGIQISVFRLMSVHMASSVDCFDGAKRGLFGILLVSSCSIHS